MERISMFHVEEIKVSDYPFAVQLANTMNWNMTLEDFEFMVKLEPQGCFVLFHRQERLGIVTCISFGKVGWFGNLVVKADAQREGAGNFLTTHAINYLKSKGANTIGLYAYPHLVKFYKHFGFESDIDFSVLKGNVSFPKTQPFLQAARKCDIPEIINFDCRCFGANRKKLLKLILFNKSNLCYVSTQNNEIEGYVAAKVYGKMAEVGPLICNTNRAEDALLLLKTIFSKLNGLEVFIYIPKRETAYLNILYEAGLKEDFRVVRMFLGSAIAKTCIYTAESLERG
jgi:GNAT superfamily N-acetyltransferase